MENEYARQWFKNSMKKVFKVNLISSFTIHNKVRMEFIFKGEASLSKTHEILMH
ncbi:MAG: hypothetical protein KKH92_03030 [Firmicutes bacterium]|nr:hypothetical protein [Bacillota bacterium]